MKEEMEAILDRHKQDLVNATKVQELATMLQESHRFADALIIRVRTMVHYKKI